MLVYLLFIFACGWCVCWLLFLNYQQHSRDSERLVRLKRRLRLKSQLRGPKRNYRMAAQDDDLADEEEGEGEGEEDVDVDVDDEEEEEEEEEAELYVEQARHANDLESQYQERLPGGHQLIVVDSEGSNKLLESRHHELDDLGLELLDMNLMNELQGRREPEAQSEQLIRGWPGPEVGPNELEDEYEEDELIDLWPIVELHENPLTSLPADELKRRQTAESQRDQLERSRLLSMAGGEMQSKHRAAIRMVSLAEVVFSVFFVFLEFVVSSFSLHVRVLRGCGGVLGRLAINYFSCGASSECECESRAKSGAASSFWTSRDRASRSLVLLLAGCVRWSQRASNVTPREASE